MDISHAILVIISQHLRSAEFGLFKRPPWEPIGSKQHIGDRIYEIIVNLSRIWFVTLCHVTLEENECPLPYQSPSRSVFIFHTVEWPLDSDALFLLLRQGS